MKAVTKTIARLTILCYLVVASIAAAHAFPMAIDISTDDSQALLAEESASMGDMQADCHQTNTVSSDANSMSLCKIFCSATGYAVTSEMVFIVASITPPLETHALSDNFSTRQTSVEQHPPI